MKIGTTTAIDETHVQQHWRGGLREKTMRARGWLVIGRRGEEEGHGMAHSGAMSSSISMAMLM
jgi:hypothetical protein